MCKMVYIFLLSIWSFPNTLEKDISIDHSMWDNLLATHVTSNGMVDYKAFLKDHDKLKAYLDILSSNPPDKENWGRDQRLAYWINAYNAFTVHLILKNYPVESINDIGPWLSIPFINSVFDEKFIQIGNEKFSLNNIEHGIIRERFDEPRIHFALVCAARSCPELRNEAYVADRLEHQLQDQAEKFIHDPSKNRISTDQLDLSKIFKWYSGDFTDEGSLIHYISEFTDKRISSDAEIDYMDYDWSLNEAKE